MNYITALSISRYYHEAWTNYICSLEMQKYLCWDYVIVTAANEEQAYGYRKQIEKRLSEGYLPPKTEYIVLADPEGRRIGSGGATLNALRHIGNPRGKRTLIIHSGGDSKRVPQYSLSGKIFSPVPHALNAGRYATLFDEILISVSGVPEKIPYGLFLVSGDVLLLWNPLQMDMVSERGATAISFKESVELGEEHGVYRGNEDGRVAEFLHKQSRSVLREHGAVNEKNLVDIDTGALFLSDEILQALNPLLQNSFDEYVNDKVRLSLYGDLLYPMASESTLEAFYKEKTEGIINDQLMKVREEIWKILRSFRINLVRQSPAYFLHFGTSREILSLLHKNIKQYKELNWNHQINSCSYDEKVAVYNSIVEEYVHCGEYCYLEHSHVYGQTVIGNHVVLSNVEIENETIPDNVVLHGLRLKNGRYIVRIYNIFENPKDKLFFGQKLDKSLWESEIFPVTSTMKEAVRAALNLYEIVHGSEENKLDKAIEKRSFKTSWEDADIDEMFRWEQKLQDWIKLESIKKKIREGVPADKVEIQISALSEEQKRWIERKLDGMTQEERVRMYYYIAQGLNTPEREQYIEHCFDTIRSSIIQSQIDLNRKVFKIQHDECMVQLPLRVNWGGGWTDTPPYCNDQGGTVFNVAILVNGEKPVKVKMKHIAEKRIIFDSYDMNCRQESVSLEELQKCDNPHDPFAIIKAALMVCGIVPYTGGTMEKLVNQLGGGFSISTEVTGIPKGSGLGTSSILAAACVKCIMKFMGITCEDIDIIHKVLCIEQLVSTGGGWQDQIGGLFPGIKLITSIPGNRQRISINKIKIPSQTLVELQQRFLLIYTGKNRLAKNQLREVMGRYIGQDTIAIEVLETIKHIAVLMCSELIGGNIDGFAMLLSQHWELSKKLDTGCTNIYIDQVVHSIEDLIDGCMICGAGGGGFLQVIMKKNISKEQLQVRVKENCTNNGVYIIDTTFY